MVATRALAAGEAKAARHNLIFGIIIVTLLLLGVTIVLLARGGRADPPNLRAAATLLDGAWKFRIGDDPRWAGATDDRNWETIDLTAPPGSHDGDVGLPDYVSGWMAHGHAGYTGYAWYRRTIDIPAGNTRWDILGPTAVEDGYELYWNGKLLGGSGRIGADPRLVGVRPLRFALPVDAAGTRGVLAIRVFMLTRAQPGKDGGGLRTSPILAPQLVADGLHRAQWARTIAGYVVDAIEPLAMFGIIALAAFVWSDSDEGGFLMFASIALALTALRRLNNATVSWTDLIDLKAYSWMAKYMAAPTIAAWTLAWNRCGGRAWRGIDVLAIFLMLAGIAGTVLALPVMTDASRYASIALLVLIGVRNVRGLAAVVLALLIIALFGGELLDPLGVPGIWFPFGIGVSRPQYLYAITLPLLAVLVARSWKPTHR